MEINEELILRLAQEGKQQSPVSVPWAKHVDLFLDRRLSISEMTRILNAGGHIISRQRVNTWLLRNRLDESSYLRKKTPKSVIDPTRSRDTFIDSITNKKGNRIHDRDEASSVQRKYAMKNNKQIDHDSKGETVAQAKTAVQVNASKETDLDRMLKRIDESVEYRSKF